MTSTTITRSPGSQSGPAPEPGAEVAAEQSVTAESAAPTINYTSIYVSSVLAVSVFFFLGVGIPLAIALDSVSGGLALGAFTAFWGGPSFGVMTGSARVSAFQERHGLHD